MKIGQKGIVLVSIPLVFLGAVLLAETWLVNNEEKLLLSESRSKQITALSTDLAARALNCRTAVSLYAYTTSAPDLNPLIRTKKEIPQALTALLELASADPLEHDYAASLVQLSQDFLSECDAQVSAASTAGSTVSLTRLSKLEQMINAKVDAMRLRELYLVGQKPNEAVLFREKFQSFILLTAIIGVLLAMAMLYFFSREIAERLTKLSTNAGRLAKEQPLLQPIAGDDEISYVDKAFHQAADAITAATAVIRAEESRLRTVIDSMPVAVLLVREDGTIDFANRASERLIGRSANEIIGIPVRNFVDVPHEINNVPHESQMRTSDKGEIPVEVRVEHIRLSANADLVVAAADVRDRKKMERMRQQFISMLTHELRSPLTSVSLVLQMLEYGAHGELEDEAVQSVKEAKRVTERLLRLVGELLTYDKITAGAIELNLSEIDLEKLLQQAITEVTPLATRSQVMLRLEIRQPTALLADEARLTQVMVNLLNNGIKFSPKEGLLEVRVSRPDESCVKVEVVDRGQGVPEDKVDVIFDLYKQAASEHTISGTGLGLPICKGIIEAHGGAIGVTANEGGGSTFWFTLPLKFKESPSSQAPITELVGVEQAEEKL